MNLYEKAQKKLDDAYQEVQQERCMVAPQKELIDKVIDGKHLTFKYILFTSILSKATDETLNPLALQSGSNLPGAYNARDVCHKVIVPFEQTTLGKILGGSNEPFLNKPARYTELKKDNPVRKGQDQELLNSLVENLPNMTTSDSAYINLKYLLSKLLGKIEERSQITNFTVLESESNPLKIKEIISKIVSSSFEGETVTLVIAALYSQLFSNEYARVEVHPVNQSGASTKEVSDLDIYFHDQLIINNEIKDKVYKLNDVRHAVDKVITSGGQRMLFIEGPRGKLEEEGLKELIDGYAQEKFHLELISFEDFVNFIISIIPNININDFLQFIIQTINDKKFKTELLPYIREIANESLEIQ